MDHIEVGGKTFISARRASEVSGYSPDYLGQLCRGRKIRATRVGRAWFIDPSSLTAHMESVHSNDTIRTTQRIFSEPVSYELVSRLGWGEVSTVVPDDAPLIPHLSKSTVDASPVPVSGQEKITPAISTPEPAEINTAPSEPVHVEAIHASVAPRSPLSPLYTHAPRLLSAGPVFSVIAKVATVGSLVAALSFTVATAERHISFSSQPHRAQLAALVPLEMVEVENAATTSTAAVDSPSIDEGIDGRLVQITQGDIKILGTLDVGTIDTVYTIGGTKYATYGHSTVGVREEVGVRLEVDTLNTATGYYEHTISFADLPRGSDLWLFYQVTDFGADWGNLVVTLTPGFDGRVFYRVEPSEKRLVVTSTASGPVSLRLFANRFDASNWSSRRPDQTDPFTHFTLDEKN